MKVSMFLTSLVSVVTAVSAEFAHVAAATAVDGDRTAVETDIKKSMRQAGAVIRAHDDNMAIDVDDDETSPSSSFSRNDIDKKTAPVRLNIRGGSGGDDKGTGENIDNLINKNESKEVEQGFTPHLPFLSSDEVVGDNACATVTHYGYWDDDQKVQPDPSLGYTCEGPGVCLDANGYTYSYVVFIDIASQAACADKCAALTNSSEYHRGFQYKYNARCYCLYDEGEAPENVPGSLLTSNSPGQGPVASSNGLTVTVCFSKSGPSPSTSPTGTPTISPTKNPTTSPTTSPTGSPTFHKQYVIKSADGTNLQAYPDGEVDLASSVDTDMVWTIEPVEEGKCTIESSYGTYLRANLCGDGSKVDLASSIGYFEKWNIVLVDTMPGIKFSIKSFSGDYLQGHLGGEVDLQTYVGSQGKWTLEEVL